MCTHFSCAFLSACITLRRRREKKENERHFARESKVALCKLCSLVNCSIYRTGEIVHQGQFFVQAKRTLVHLHFGHFIVRERKREASRREE